MITETTHFLQTRNNCWLLDTGVYRWLILRLWHGKQVNVYCQHVACPMKDTKSPGLCTERFGEVSCSHEGMSVLDPLLAWYGQVVDRCAALL